MAPGLLDDLEVGVLPLDQAVAEGEDVEAEPVLRLASRQGTPPAPLGIALVAGDPVVDRPPFDVRMARHQLSEELPERRLADVAGAVDLRPTGIVKLDSFLFVTQHYSSICSLARRQSYNIRERTSFCLSRSKKRCFRAPVRCMVMTTSSE